MKPGRRPAERGRRVLACAALLVATTFAGPGTADSARADAGLGSGTGSRVVDATVARFYAPETGGAAQPLFVRERALAFEARLEALAEHEGSGEDYDSRHVRAALDRAIAEGMLAILGQKLIWGLPPSRRPGVTDLADIQRDVSAALFDRVGGRARLDAAASAEQMDADEVEGLLRRQALAAFYLDRAIAPLLRPSDEQLRAVFRTAAHPFRGQNFDAIRSELARWFVFERFRLAETAFMQGARARVRVVVTAVPSR